MNHGHLLSKKVEDISELRNEYGIIDNYVQRTLPRRGPNPFSIKDIPNSDINKIIQMYEDGYSTYIIGDAFSMSYKPIAKILKQHDIQRKYNGNTSKRNYTLNEHYFDVIDTQNKAYILGMLFADGHNDTEKNVVTLSLQEEDKEILDKISIELGSNKPLYYVHNEELSKKHGLKMKNQYRLRVSSYIMSQALKSLGCTNRKSLTLQFPVLPQHLYQHFIRGYFDGDGCLCKSIRNDGKQDNYSIEIISTNDFLVKARDCIIQNTGVPGGGITNGTSKNGITMNLRMCGRLQTKTIMDWLYKDAELYLKRKHDRYLSYYYENNSQVAQRTTE